MEEQLSEELETYEANRERLLADHEGEFVLIHDKEILGTFENQMDAVKSGYRQLGNVPFLVKEVVKDDMPLRFVSNLLGV